MKLGKIKIYYIPYNKSQLQVAREEMAKVTVEEAKAIAIGAAFIVATTVQTLYAQFSIDEFTQKVQDGGFKALRAIQVLGYFAALVFCGIDIVKNIKKQDISAILSTALKYTVAVMILYGLPDVFDIGISFFGHTPTGGVR